MSLRDSLAHHTMIFPLDFFEECPDILCIVSRLVTHWAIPCDGSKTTMLPCPWRAM